MSQAEVIFRVRPNTGNRISKFNFIVEKVTTYTNGHTSTLDYDWAETKEEAVALAEKYNKEIT